MGPVVDWPVVGVHVALLPNGKVLAYDSVGDTRHRDYRVHDPHARPCGIRRRASRRRSTSTPASTSSAAAWRISLDGRLFLAGGNKDAQLNGIVQTHLFDSADEPWSLGPNMAAGRWYPTVTPLHNGEMLITRAASIRPRSDARGRPAGAQHRVAQPAAVSVDGRRPGRPGLLLRSRPDDAHARHGRHRHVAVARAARRINRDYGGHALFDVGKMLVAGGGPSSKDARVIDLNGATPQVSATAPMAFGRRQHNLTVLADGTVLATGGNSSGAGLVDLNAGVYPAEQWNPATGTVADPGRDADHAPVPLDRAAAARRARAVLRRRDLRHLRPGRLPRQERRDLLAAVPLQGESALAPRPVIDAAPASTSYGAPFEIATGSPASIGKSPSSGSAPSRTRTTWSSAMSRWPSPAARRAHRHRPANANVAPPGSYMLFIVDTDGVPSVAHMVTVTGSSAAADRHAHQAGQRRAFTAPATVSVWPRRPPTRTAGSPGSSSSTAPASSGRTRPRL